MTRFYLCIDLKSFFASVECVDRNLDPYKVDLVVSDNKTNGAICLAISPKMRLRGIKNRCRIYEIPKNINPIIVSPHMKKYEDYSKLIYEIYLEFVSASDIYVYSIDEVFIDITNYLRMYNKNPVEMADFIIKTVYKRTKITATCGVGTNIYLAKVAMDIISKSSASNIGFLNEKIYKEKLWHYKPLTDFWQIGDSMLLRLNKLKLYDMYDISCCDEKILYKEFGIIAKRLIQNSKGYDDTTISNLKNYIPKKTSISNSQILYKDYNYKEAKSVLIEIIDNIVLRLVAKNSLATTIGFSISYSKNNIAPINFSKKLIHPTNNYNTILQIILNAYDLLIDKDYCVRKIGVYLGDIKEKKYEQLDLFNNYVENSKIEKLETTINEIKDKYGKNSILRGVSYLEESTIKERNNLYDNNI